MASIVNMPKLGFDMAEGTLVRWVISEGESVTAGAVIAEIETDKATVEVESTYEGIVISHLVGEGDIVPINMPIAVIGNEGEEVDVSEFVGEKALPSEEASTSTEETVPVEVVTPVVEPGPIDIRLPAGLRASPLARRMAKEHSVDLMKIRGSGPDGRIVKRDIETYLSELHLPMPVRDDILASEISMASIHETEIIPLNRLRAAIGRRMVEVKQQVPHFYVTHEYGMTEVMNLRKQINAMLPDDEKISVNDFIIKAVALCLREYPNLNASLDVQNQAIVHHGQVNVGVAVAVENGLLTVVSRDADIKPLRMISSDVRGLVSRARDGKVRPEDIEGSTFTVSNLGMFDVEHFIAIINPPETAILAVGSVREVPVVEDGQVVPGLQMKATISVDHRVSDGAEAARFLQAMEIYLESPLRLLI
jgi:pyruvate dehydrogenase E2 component (dihydrolipoamide acetyltransferase)